MTNITIQKLNKRNGIVLLSLLLMTAGCAGAGYRLIITPHLLDQMVK